MTQDFILQHAAPRRMAEIGASCYTIELFDMTLLEGEVKRFRIDQGCWMFIPTDMANVSSRQLVVSSDNGGHDLITAMTQRYDHCGGVELKVISGRPPATVHNLLYFVARPTAFSHTPKERC